MKINKPTYLIAELIGDVESLVMDMRKRFNPDDQYLPAHITIAGSSGVGILKFDQSLEYVVERFTPIVQQFGFNDISFIGVDRFPQTGIYYLKPEREKFDRLHEAIAHTDVQFEEIEWPYNPHCTLRWHDHDSAECRELFDSVCIPTKSSISCISLYQPADRSGCRIHRF